MHTDVETETDRDTKSQTGIPGGSAVKSLPAVQETQVRSQGREGPLEEAMGNTLLYACLESPHGQRSLVGYRPWSRKESDTT